MDHQDHQSQNRQYDEQPGLEVAPNSWASAPIPYEAAPENQGPATATDPKWMAAQQQYPVQGDLPPSSSAEKHRILGLTKPVFWGLVVVLVISLTGGIAGGVAGGLTTRKGNSSLDKQDSQTSTTATTATSVDSQSSTTATTATSVSLATTGTARSSGVRPAPTDAGCPWINGTAYIPTNGKGDAIRIGENHHMSFQQLCEVNYPSGAMWGNPYLYDILKTYVSSFEECMTLCALHNVQYAINRATNSVSEGGWCRSVALIKEPGEYCYLKNGTGKNDTQGHAADFVSAILTQGL